MNETRARRLARGIWGLSLVFLAVGAVLHVVTRNVPITIPFAFRGSDVAMSGVIGAVGVLIAARRSDNPIGWLLLTTSALGAFVYPAINYVILSVHDHGGTLPATNVLGWIQNWLWVTMMGMLGVAVALFPDGRFLSHRWRGFFTLFAPVGIAVFAAAIALTPEELQGLPKGFDNPYAGAQEMVDVITSIGGVLFLAILIGIVICIVQRFRRSTGVAREQMKWLVPSGFALALTFAVGLPFFLTLGDSEGLAIQLAAGAIMVAILSIPIAMGIAILRHRLYDIDVVLNKAVVFAALVAGITLVYVAVVVGIGTAVGSRGKPNVALSVGATAAVAVAFQPLRSWAHRVANRLVFGKRATPQEVLSALGGRIAESYSLDEVLPRLAQLMTEATAASRAEVWLRVGGELKPAAAWPHAVPSGAVPLPDGEVPAIAGTEQVFPVRHQGELLGVLAAAAPPNEPMTATDERLLADLASHAGLVLRNVALIEDLRASRQRLVSAQDQERRKIERNLHDGAQQQLVALSINLRLVRTLVDGDPAQAAQMLEQLQSDAADALENLRDLAHGIYPPLLADRGLGAALTSQAGKAPVPTTVEASGMQRYPVEVEAAVYYCVLEALQNIAKYAGATKAIVRLAEDAGRLTFAVTDDGAGFDVAHVARGAGLTNMTDRLEALGGSIELESAPGAGTTVRGWIVAAPIT